MTKDDVLFGYRQQLFAEAARTSVSAACRMFGVHRSTYYAWKRQVDRHGLEMLRPRERRRPQMPNQLPKMVQERIVSFSIAHPGLGPRRVASELAREKWGGIVVSPNGVWKVLCRHGLNTRAKRLGLIAGYAAPYAPPRTPEPERHIDVQRPGELVGIDCFYVGRLKGTEGAIWQLTAIDIASSYAWADLVICKAGQSDCSTGQPARPACRTGAKERRLATGAPALRQRQRVQGRLQQDHQRPENASHPDPRRQTTDQRTRRGATQDHPRRVLATRVRSLPLPPLHRSQTRVGHLPTLLQLRPRPPRAPHARTHPRRHRLRSPKDGGKMSHTCRHISEAAQPKRQLNLWGCSSERGALWPGSRGSGVGDCGAGGGCRVLGCCRRPPLSVVSELAWERRVTRSVSWAAGSGSGRAPTKPGVPIAFSSFSRPFSCVPGVLCGTAGRRVFRRPHACSWGALCGRF
jgi:transposase